MAGEISSENQQAGQHQSSSAAIDNTDRQWIGSFSRERWYQWLKWGDYLLYGLIGGPAILLLFLFPRLINQIPTSAVVTMDGNLLLEIPYEQLINSGETEVTANGFHYLVAWQDGQVRFTEADCPDKVCVRTGWISHSGEIAACAPGNLILKLTGEMDSDLTDDELDVIVK